MFIFWFRSFLFPLSHIFSIILVTMADWWWSS